MSQTLPKPAGLQPQSWDVTTHSNFYLCLEGRRKKKNYLKLQITIPHLPARGRTSFLLNLEYFFKNHTLIGLGLAPCPNSQTYLKGASGFYQFKRQNVGSQLWCSKAPASLLPYLQWKFTISHCLLGKVLRMKRRGNGSHLCQPLWLVKESHGQDSRSTSNSLRDGTRRNKSHRTPQGSWEGGFQTSLSRVELGLRIF